MPAAVVAGAGLWTLAVPPFDLRLATVLVLVPVLAVLRRATPLVAALAAGATATLATALSCGWWLPTLERFASLPSAAAAVLALLLAVYQGLPYALWGGAVGWLVRRRGAAMLWLAPFLLALAEAWWPFPFHHYLALTAWHTWPLTQAAELGGPVAVSALLVLLHLVVLAGLDCAFDRRAPERAAVLGAAAVLLVLLAGWARARHVDRARAAADPLRVGVVQPNRGVVSAARREREGQRLADELRRATARLEARGSDLVVWGESAWPFVTPRGQWREQPPRHPWRWRPAGSRSRLLFGSLTARPAGGETFNSAVLVSASGRVAGVYDKVRTVPFAESVPLAGRFPGWAAALRRRLPEWPEITAGSGPAVLADGDLRLGVLICAEDLDPALTRQVASQRIDLLVAIASDAWLDFGAAPRQHLALSVFRAVESRRDLVRATTTGVSALVDAVGRVRRRAPGPGEPGAAVTLLYGDVARLGVRPAGATGAALFPWLCVAVVVTGFRRGASARSAATRRPG